MTTVITAPPDVPDLLGTAPADLIDRHTEAPVSTRDVAVRRAERIRAGVAAYAAMRQDIADAYAQRDWLALDYATWHEYVQAEFGQELSALARDDRREAVQDLRTQGMSTRQIAQVTGVDQKTVRNDLAEVRTYSSPATVTGSDGKQYPASRPSTPDAALATPPSSTSAGQEIPPERPDAEHAEGDARRDAELDAQMADTEVRFRRNLSAAIARADDVWSFDVDRIAEVYAADWDTELRPFLEEMTRWCERVTQACRQRGTGLRVMQGGRK